jgi:hypothetical protein
MTRLDKLKEKMQSPSYADVIRRTITIVNIAVDHVDDDGAITIVTKDGTHMKIAGID